MRLGDEVADCARLGPSADGVRGLLTIRGGAAVLDVQDEVGLLLAAVVHTGREGAPAALFALGLGETGLAIRGGLDVREAKAIRNRVWPCSQSTRCCGWRQKDGW